MFCSIKLGKRLWEGWINGWKGGKKEGKGEGGKEGLIIGGMEGYQPAEALQEQLYLVSGPPLLP